MNKAIIKSLSMLFLSGFMLIQCDLIGAGEEEDDSTTLAALLLAANSSSSLAVFTITNNSGSSATYTFYVAGSTCSTTAIATSSAVANGSSGTISVAALSSGYDIKDGGGNCSAVGTGTTAKTYTCTDPGGGGLTCS